MGTEINLRVGGISIDWAKNNPGNDHGFLFQECDRTRRHSEQIDYEYCAEDPEADLALLEESLVRRLVKVLPRLNLAGYTLDKARDEYNALLAEEDDQEKFNVLTFDEFCEFVGRFPLGKLDDTYIDNDPDMNRMIKERFRSAEAEIERLPSSYDTLYWSEKSYFASKICVLSPYSMLQVFGTSESNRDAEVVWDYGLLVDSGWAPISAFTAGSNRSQTILVATEGTTDSRILKRALDTLRADISDFFKFVDVDERHPFWGTGNLVKFAEGLVRIDIQNKVLFILDNDAEGVDALKRLKELNMPSNMRAMLLPDLDAFKYFQTIGPEGTHTSDINGRAAAIECYLDLLLPNYGPAQVRWSNYKKDIDAWQGALEHKETYMRHFLDQTPETLRSEGYDTTKLECVLDAITIQAVLLQQELLD